MNAEPNDSPVPSGKHSKRVWVIGCLIGIVIAGVMASFVSYQPRIECTLADGSVVICDGVVKGKKVSDSDFEPDVYAYRGSWFRPRTEGMERLFGVLKNFGRFREAERYRYSEAPVLVLGGFKSGPSVEYQSVALHDGLGNEFDNVWPSFRSDQPEPVNHKQLPMASKHWTFEFRNKQHQSIGQITVSNPSFHRKPGFEGKHAPLESKSAQGVLKLVSAKFTTGKGGGHEGWKYVNLRFDAAGCPGLLPCQIIGVRVTDSWGNTSLIDGSLGHDGKTIRACWRSIDEGAMQSPDWHVRIAICRGMKAAFKPSEIVRFDHLPPVGANSRSIKKTLGGRELVLLEAFSIDPSRPDEWTIVKVDWEIDDKGPILWPVVTRVVGRLPDGGSMEVDPSDCEERLGRAEYWIRRERMKPNTDSAPTLYGVPDFRANFRMPAGFSEYDMDVALEDPTVFEFKVKVANWPSPTGGPR